jgi:alpha-N-arabinofuranosidase
MMEPLYQNPLLSGFYPDPSICRAGTDFYLVTSTFAYFPGIPVFHSKDLAHWTQIGSAIHRPDQLHTNGRTGFDGHRISEGLFAPTIRYHNGTFYILCTLIRNGGNFVITAADPAGPWSDPVWLDGAVGIDPSIFFDDDGKVWYTGTRPAPEGEAYPGNWEIYLQELNPAVLCGAAQGSPLIGQSHGLWRGALRDCIWPEGPHLYKINGMYYLLHAEGGTGPDHAVCVARSESLFGTWKGKPSNPVVTHRHLGRRADIINVGHADMIEDTEGNWWMALLASRPFEGVCPLGRETFLVPLFWEDDWPFIGTKSGLVELKIEQRDNKVAATLAARECRSRDYFNQEKQQMSLPLHWLTLRTPAKKEDAAFSLTENPAALRLFTQAATMRGKDPPAFAGRRIQHKDWTFSAAFEFTPKTAGDAAGIVLLQSEDWQYRLEVTMDADGACFLRLVRAAGAPDEVMALLPYTPPATFVLAASCKDMEITFLYGNDADSLTAFARRADMKILSSEYAGGFVGTLAGLFATGNGADTGNYADVLWAAYREL